MFERLLDIAGAARSFMEPIWLEWQGDDGRARASTASKATCGRSSLFVQRVLRHEGFDACWANGIPRHSEEGPDLGPFGFFSGMRWESHAWVETEGWIVDITADQFGAAPVIVVPATDARYGRRTIDTASPDRIERRARQIDEIWPSWLATRADTIARSTEGAS